eukprot:TRINITY_DN65758_c6_g2_i2.p3 TRINITY_DN65758_c6_g2~~TRINITY_DN65758_c6_g2_i2.p3  ORF type:complete len:101 (-),score=10.19 TRINITY_DN65758_c6_g2_i2:579-881(-)
MSSVYNLVKHTFNPFTNGWMLTDSNPKKRTCCFAYANEKLSITMELATALTITPTPVSLVRFGQSSWASPATQVLIIIIVIMIMAFRRSSVQRGGVAAVD